MLTKLYTIRDKVAEESGPIFQAKNDAIASRQFQQVISKSESPRDYVLIRIGEFETERTLLTALQVPEEVELSVNSEVIE